jgi:hypothetical protein
MKTSTAGLALVLAAGLLAAVWCSGSGGPTSAAGDSSPRLAGDGTTDDTAALQALLDAGGSVRLERGLYRISRSLVLDLRRAGYTSLDGGGVAQLVMHGAGPALRIVGTHFRSADPEGFRPEVWQRERMPLVRGLGIEGAHAEADGIEAISTMQLTVSLVHVRGVRHAIRLRENNRNVIVSECHLYHNRGAGILYDEVNLHQSNIVGCHISYNAGGGVVCRGGNVRNIHITGCDLESNMAPDAPAAANVLIDCRHSQHGTAEVAITGCTIQHNNPSPDSANIRIVGRSQLPDGTPQREGHVTITGNVLSDVQVNIHLQDCRGVVIAGNTLWQGYRHDLLIERCAHVVLGPNNLERNPRYNYGNTHEVNGGVVLRDCEDCTILGLHVAHVWRHVAGVLLENCRRMHVAGCTILDCDGAGLVLKNVSDSRIAGLLIRDDRPAATSLGLVLEGGSGNVLGNDLLIRRPVRVDRQALAE